VDGDQCGGQNFTIAAEVDTVRQACVVVRRSSGDRDQSSIGRCKCKFPEAANDFYRYKTINLVDSKQITKFLFDKILQQMWIQRYPI
jgi:hypothetical protein